MQDLNHLPSAPLIVESGVNTIIITPMIDAWHCRMDESWWEGVTARDVHRQFNGLTHENCNTTLQPQLQTLKPEQHTIPHMWFVSLFRRTVDQKR